MLYVIKGFLLVKIVDIWLHLMAYMLCLRVVFPSKNICGKDFISFGGKDFGYICATCIG
jgi:hypothetical protein